MLFTSDIVTVCHREQNIYNWLLKFWTLFDISRFDKQTLKDRLLKLVIWWNVNELVGRFSRRNSIPCCGLPMAAMRGKTAKTVVLPGFFKIECGGCSNNLVAASAVVWLSCLPKIYCGSHAFPSLPLYPTQPFASHLTWPLVCPFSCLLPTNQILVLTEVLKLATISSIIVIRSRLGGLLMYFFLFQRIDSNQLTGFKSYVKYNKIIPKNIECLDSSQSKTNVH